jgi:hypothetical protein
MRGCKLPVARGGRGLQVRRRRCGRAAELGDAVRARVREHNAVVEAENSVVVTATIVKLLRRAADSVALSGVYAGVVA